MKEEIRIAAIEWYNQHKAHVERLRKSSKLSYEPSRQDLRNPALWKDAHWNWFIEQFLN